MMRAFALFAGIVLVASPAAAQEASIAEQLFLDGKALMKEGRVEEACQKFQASHEADAAATGTLLNLALCHEQLGKYASAWAEFRAVASESAGKREDRVALAREHEAQVLPKLSYLTIVVRPETRALGPRVVLDGKRPITEGMWQTRLPVDPGKHTLVVDAPGKAARTYDVVIGARSDDKTVDVGALEDAKQASTTPAPATNGDPTRRTIGYVLGGVGVAGLGVGAVFGVMALGKSHDVTTACPNDVCPIADTPNNQPRSDLSSAKSLALGADIALAAGAVLVITGGVLVWTAREKAAPSARLRVGPTSMLVEGSF